MTLRLYLHKPAVILAARVDLGGNDPVYPQNSVAFDGVTSGSVANLVSGMTMSFGTAPGLSDLGMARFVLMDPTYPTSAFVTSYFSEGTNVGEVTLVDNSYVTVWDDFRVWAKI